MPPRHPTIGRALGLARQPLQALRAALGPPGEGPLPLLVACSGGADSVALLGLLHLVADADRLVLSVGHVDHGLRAASAAESELVRELAARLGLPFMMERLQLEPGSGLAARSREARRAALERMAAANDTAAVVLGHTATDQAETLLLHATRGAGLDGLGAMAPLQRMPWGWRLRPLLELTRDETRDLAERLGLQFVDDPTNEDVEQPRVMIRKHVLPVLRRLRPDVEVAMAASAERVREAAECIAAWVQRELDARRIPGIGSTGARFDVARLAEMPPAVRLRLIRAVCLESTVDADAVGRRLIRSVDAALRGGGRPRAWDLRGGFRLRLEGGRLWVETVSDDAPTDAHRPGGPAGPIAE